MVCLLNSPVIIFLTFLANGLRYVEAFFFNIYFIICLRGAFGKWRLHCKESGMT